MNWNDKMLLSICADTNKNEKIGGTEGKQHKFPLLALWERVKGGAE